MPITANDLEFRLSINDGPGDSEAQADPNDSIGGFVSTTEITDATLHNLFDVITGDENAAETIDYRLFFVHNAHETLTWQGVVVWVQDETAGAADAAIALDDVGVTDVDSSDPQSERIANETTAPSGETFSAPTSKGTGLEVGDVGPGRVFGVWVRRTATDSGAQNLDGIVIRAEGDTAE